MTHKLIILLVMNAFILESGQAGAGQRMGIRSRSANTAQAVAPAITWTHLVNCQISNGTLQKTTGCNGCADASAFSGQSLISGDGYLQLTADTTTTDRYCGLSYQANGPNYTAIDFAFHLSAAGYLEVREDNAYKTDVRYTAGDVLKVSIESGVVKYYKNGGLIYRSRKVPVYPLVADASLLTLNSTVANAVGTLNSSAPLLISSVASSAISASGAGISWTTSAPADSKVDFGLTAAYGTTAVFGTSLVTNHVGSLGGLSPATIYHFRVRSQDQFGNAAVSGDYSFVTAAAFAILSQSSSNISSAGITLMWTTNFPGDSQVQYGTTTSYGFITSLDGAMTTVHTVTLSGLQPNVTYDYRLLSHDSAGDITVSGNLVVSTLPLSPPGVAVPAVSVDTTMPASPGLVHTVNAGGDLQMALNQAQPGDTVVLQAGAVFAAPAGGFVLPAKSNPNQLWIVIRTSDMTNLPASGTRVGPANAASMPKLLSTDTSGALVTETGSAAGSVAYWRLLGVEVSVTQGALPDANLSGAAANTGLVRLGDPYETSLQNVPHHLVVDRCYIHGGPTVNTIRGINLNSAYSAVIDSYLSDFHGVQWESQAIAGWNGPGPYKIANDFLEAASENVMFGGADPQIQGLIPSDIDIRHNHFFKPLTWQMWSSTYAGYHWTVKNLFELKNASRVLVYGNVFDNCWMDAQIGYAISIKSSNQDGMAPWSQTSDVTVEDNIIRNAAIGLQVAARDNTSTIQFTTRVSVNNNVFEDINSAASGGPGTLIRIIGHNAPAGLASSGPSYVTVDHNTGFAPANSYGKMVEVDDTSPNFVFTNNLFDYCSYAVKGDGTADGNQTITTYFPGVLFTKNAITGNSAGLVNFSGYAGNYFPGSWSDVQFVNYNGGLGGDYHLLSTSPYKNAGTDGTDLGAGTDAVSAATALVN
jgi:hypothetical protein